MIVVAVFAVLSLSQTEPHATPNQSESRVYEDDEVRIAIPAGWTRASGNYPSLEPYRSGGAVVVGNSVLQAQAKLLLQKDGYTLGLAYRTQHASGVVGGHFIEAFDIPWLSPNQAWNQCSGVLTYIPQPAGPTLLFQNILFETDSVKVRSACGIPEDLGKWVGEGPQKRFIGARRWYGGYFTSDGGYFFDESDNCESKVYSLTTSAKTPAQLPIAEDPHLEQIIQEAIDIVNSVHYKRCAPKPASPLR